MRDGAVGSIVVTESERDTDSTLADIASERAST
jgi:hypothetical protein